MATISNTPRPGYVWDATDNCWYPIGIGAHQHTNPSDTPGLIPNTTVTTKGDILVATGNATIVRQGVGTDGQVLTADSSQADGVAWATPPTGAPVVSGKNFLINGAFDIWQRGTSFTADAVYTADRWISSMQTSNATISQVTSGLPSGFRNAVRVQRNSGSTSTSLISIAQAIETVNSIPLQGQTVTLSFWARRGANLSDAAGQIFIRMYSGTGTDQNAASYGSWTGYSEWHSAGAVTLTTSWVRYSITGTVPSNGTQIGIRVGFGPTGTAGANDWFDITGAQLEAGSTATGFSRSAGSIQQEFAACQRYFQSYNNGGSQYILPQLFAFGDGSFFGMAVAEGALLLPVRMRVAPTLATTGTWAGFAFANHSITGTFSLEWSYPTNVGFRFQINSGSWTGGVGFAYSTSNGYVNLSAEL